MCVCGSSQLYVLFLHPKHRPLYVSDITVQLFTVQHAYLHVLSVQGPWPPHYEVCPLGQGSLWLESPAAGETVGAGAHGLRVHAALRLARPGIMS